MSSSLSSSSPPILHFYRRTTPPHSLLPTLLSTIPQLNGILTSISTENCFNVATSHPLSPDELFRLEWLLVETFAPSDLHPSQLFFFTNDTSTIIFEFGPRMTFTSAFSSDAVSICQSCRLSSITRLEKSRRYLITLTSILSDSIKDQIREALHHCMTEEEYLEPLLSFEIGAVTKEVTVVLNTHLPPSFVDFDGVVTTPTTTTPTIDLDTINALANDDIVHIADYHWEYWRGNCYFVPTDCCNNIWFDIVPRWGRPDATRHLEACAERCAKQNDCVAFNYPKNSILNECFIIRNPGRQQSNILGTECSRFGETEDWMYFTRLEEEDLLLPPDEAEEAGDNYGRPSTVPTEWGSRSGGDDDILSPSSYYLENIYSNDKAKVDQAERQAGWEDIYYDVDVEVEKVVVVVVVVS